MKLARLEKSLSLRSMPLFAVTWVLLAGIGCANRNSCMPNQTYGPYNGYPYAGQPGQPGQQPVYPSQMVGTPMNPGAVMPGQPSTFAAPPQGYPTGAPLPTGTYPQTGYGPPPGAPGGQPYVGR